MVSICILYFLSLYQHYRPDYSSIQHLAGWQTDQTITWSMLDSSSHQVTRRDCREESLEPPAPPPNQASSKHI